MSTVKRDGDPITLGSGTLMIKEFDPTAGMPVYTDFTKEDILGYIQGGATLTYKGEWYEAKDDTGKKVKLVLIDEEALLKSGLLTWNGVTLEKLCATARVSDAGGIRTVKIGGVANRNGKSYALCFHHEDEEDGDVWLLMRAVNQGGFEIAFVKNKESVVNAEFKCLPMDEEGTLVEYYEEITTEAEVG